MRGLIASENIFLTVATSLATGALFLAASIPGMPWEVPVFFGGMALGGFTLLGQNLKRTS